MWAAAGAHAAESHSHPKPVVLAPGYAPLTFTAPAAGSYRLPVLGPAADGAVIDSSGRTLQLHDLLGDRVVVLSFIYTACSDVNGCPLATHVLGEIQSRVLESDPAFARQLRLVSLSFDPRNDTPEVMAAYGHRFQREGFQWPFLTTSGEADLSPILDAYDQFIVPDYDENGMYLGSISHLLRVFLIDRARTIRNIYSVSFLHADTVLNDIRTIVAEAEG